MTFIGLSVLSAIATQCQPAGKAEGKKEPKPVETPPKLLAPPALLKLLDKPIQLDLKPLPVEPKVLQNPPTLLPVPVPEPDTLKMQLVLSAMRVLSLALPSIQHLIKFRLFQAI